MEQPAQGMLLFLPAVPMQFRHHTAYRRMRKFFLTVIRHEVEFPLPGFPALRFPRRRTEVGMESPPSQKEYNTHYFPKGPPKIIRVCYGIEILAFAKFDTDVPTS